MQIMIDSIIIHEVIDTDPDTTYIGRYTNECLDSEADRRIDRQARGDMRSGEYRYFIAEMSAAQTGNPESVMQDYERFEEYNRGGWYFLGIWVEAIVSYSTGNNCRRIERLRSAGLCGIESDSEKCYIQSVIDDELADLRNHLAVFGVDTSTFEERIRDANRRD